uniref:t-SNARE coiled-coil homology domain-containing protein n=1 Tax=Otolemur garnettii TaxID=30611 RepID=H0XPN8_OTOGA
MWDRVPELIASRQNQKNRYIIVIIDQDQFIHHFFHWVEDTRTIFKISQYVDQLKQTHSGILWALDTKGSRKEKLQGLNNHIKETAHQIRAQLKSMQQTLDHQETGEPSFSRSPCRKSPPGVHPTCSQRPWHSTTKPTVFCEQSKGRLERQLHVGGRDGPAAGGDAPEQLDLSPTTSSLARSKITRQDLNDKETAQNNIVKLEPTTWELYDIFLDKAASLETRGEMTNNIEQNVMNATDYVDDDKEETQKAVQHHGKTKRIAMILILCIILIILLASKLVQTILS